ncbi:PDR/VanB family oxidoreductase [Arthrobacter burdickii]|uniref:PDR/VanB family oxidoreductase n=1 Tax=Arthrobacter burdickii TaxID=3035920 RepID=A0ABT8JZG0_9MICC|nr:PDR/VanB family oxidoreductase [Arthrobacter burdickii]MDN4610153.1 PDR/VanB family oxidoreductase [Arthrobacter burdickii]
MFTGMNSATEPLQVKLMVTAKEKAADGVVALTLAHPDGRRLPDWTPGSHIDVVLPSGVNRQYSLCGDRWDAHSYRIAVLREPEGRGGSAYIHEELAVGTMVAVGGPRNNFRLVPSEKYVFVAGGIGITPMVPMVQQADLLGADWKLLYLGRSRTTMAFLDELAVHGDRVVVLPKDESGPCRLDELIGGPATDTKVYVCGPQRLLTAIERHCADWPIGLLRMEHFAAKAQSAPARDDAFEVELARAALSVTVSPEISIVDALQNAGISMLTSCKEGTCGTCEVAVLAGKPDHRDSILNDADRAAGHCMFPCVSRSCSDRLVLDL